MLLSYSKWDTLETYAVLEYIQVQIYIFIPTCNSIMHYMYEWLKRTTTTYNFIAII